MLRNKVAYLGVFLALALICSYVESLIPFYFGIPGVKLGLTNLVVVLMLYCVGTKEALLISVLQNRSFRLPVWKYVFHPLQSGRRIA